MRLLCTRVFLTCTRWYRRYCFSSKGPQPKVFVGSLPPTATDGDLLRAFEQSYRSTSTAHVVRRGQGQGRLYGFVAFGRQEDMEKALTKAAIKVLGEPAVIKSDTSKDTQRQAAEAARPPSQSAVGKLWEVLQSWVDSDVAGLDAPTQTVEDKELEAERLKDPAVAEEVANAFKRAKTEFRKALDERDSRRREAACDKIKAELRRLRDSRHGIERDKYASAWYTLARRDVLQPEVSAAAVAVGLTSADGCVCGCAAGWLEGARRCQEARAPAGAQAVDRGGVWPGVVPDKEDGHAADDVIGWRSGQSAGAQAAAVRSEWNRRLPY